MANACDQAALISCSPEGSRESTVHNRGMAVGIRSIAEMLEELGR